MHPHAKIVNSLSYAKGDTGLFFADDYSLKNL